MSNITEIWKDIPGYEGLYEVSNLGRVKSLVKNYSGCVKKESILRECIYNPGVNDKGYRQVFLYKEGKPKTFKVHKLVAKVFIPNPENKPEVDHINGDKNNNSVENLRWATRKENMNNPVSCKQRSEKMIGSLNPIAVKICQYSLEDKYIQTFGSISDANRYFGKDPSNGSISNCLRGKSKTAFKYKWKYEEE